MRDDLILSIDLGSTGCKIIIFDNKGSAISESYSGYPLHSTKPGFAEEDPWDWWNSTKENIRTALLRANIPPTNINVIGITGQAVSLGLLDKKGRPLRSSILTFMDSRAEKIGREMISQVGKMSISEMLVYSTLRWIKENEPDIFENIDKFIDAREFICYKLTGEISYDGCALSPVRVKKLNEAFDIPDEFFGSPHTYDKPVASVSEEIHETLGLNPEVPVVVGPWDGMCNVVGSGLTEDGLAMDIAGTTEIVVASTTKKIDIVTHPHVIDGRWLVYTSTPLAIAHKWFAEKILGWQMGLGLDVYDAINLMAEKAEGESTPIFIPTMKGEFMKPHLRGAFIGLSINHNLNHLARAIFEGIAFHLRNTLEWIEKGGLKIDEVRISGGGSKSRIWNQIKADVLGKTVKIMKTPETGALGAAMLAEVAIGGYKDLLEATREMVSIKGEINPRFEMHEKYEKPYARYKKFYDSMDELFGISE